MISRTFLLAAGCGAAFLASCGGNGGQGFGGPNHEHSSSGGGGDAGPVEGYDAMTGDSASTSTDGGGGSDSGSDSSAPTPEASTTGSIEIAMVSGNGEVLLSEWPALDPLVVRVTKGGVPLSGQTVSWTTDPDVNIGSGVTSNVTDSNGLAQVQVIGGGIMAGLSYIQGQVTATIPTGSVDFWTTTTWEGLSGMQITAQAQVLKPGPAQTLGSFKGGTVITGAIQVMVYATTGDHTGAGIPDAGIRLTANYDTTMPAPGGLVCVGGTPLTDATGTATCDVQLGSTPGTYGFQIAVAGFLEFPAMSVTITP